MVHRCCISSCGMNVRVAEAKGLSYHGFPNKEPLREQWIQAIIPHLDKPEGFKLVPKYTRVCSRHFRKKDYSVDIKKRARLNSNAVPSVFPRKNSPIVIPVVIGSPSRASKTIKLEVAAGLSTSSTTSDIVPTPRTIGLSTSRASDDSLPSSLSGSPLLCPVSWKLVDRNNLLEDGTTNNQNLNSCLDSREFIFEAATLNDDQLTLHVRDGGTLDNCSGGGGGISSSSISQEDLSQSSNFSLNINEDSNEAPHKKRKRRKWNRSAFDRPAKGKKKVDDVNIDGVGEALAEISLSTLLAIATPNLQQDKQQHHIFVGGPISSEANSSIINNNQNVPATTATEGSSSSSSANTTTAIISSISTPTTSSASNFRTVTLSLSSSHHDLVNQHLSSIEQELLQSIQAVSLHCGDGDGGNVEEQEFIVGELDSRLLSSISGRPPPFVHHSSEESIFSTTEEDDALYRISSMDPKTVNLEYHHHSPTHTGPSSISPTTDDNGGLLSQLVDGIGLDEERGPTLLEIEHLANHFNSSLLTDYNNTELSIGLGDLHLPSDGKDDKDETLEGLCTSEEIEQQLSDKKPRARDGGSSNQKRDSADGHNHTRNVNRDSTPTLLMVKPPSARAKKKAPENARLNRVTKKHKKEKICGQFSVERFSNSDKDIEYYTGFNSYRNFEAFFRSLEAYVERLRVTDVMFGVANLDKLHSSSETSGGDSTAECNSDTGGSTPSEFILPLPPPPAYDEPIKKRPFHGRSMSRIDELFMTIIRLRRKLPEKVLGHMFCISQPTVSRIIRAWTVLLSKLIDCYPIESSTGESSNTTKSNKSSTSKSSSTSTTSTSISTTTGPGSNKEHSYTSRGLGIPESFRQLFHSDLAQSIVVTSVTAKDKKTAQKPSPSSSTSSVTTGTSSAKRSKKSRVETVDPLLLEVVDTTSLSRDNDQHICDLLDGTLHDTNLLFSQLEVEECDLFAESFCD